MNPEKVFDTPLNSKVERDNADYVQKLNGHTQHQGTPNVPQEVAWICQGRCNEQTTVICSSAFINDFEKPT